jgi:5'-nucleotidase
LKEIKGVKICRQAEGTWVEKFKEGIDPRGQKYYWLTGEFRTEDDGEDHDLYALERNYVSVVPSKHDLTDHNAVKVLSHFEEI